MAEAKPGCWLIAKKDSRPNGNILGNEMIRKSVLMGALAIAGTISSASAFAVVLDFNSLAEGASNAAVQSYLNAQLGTGAITVTGATAGKAYTGDNFVNRDLIPNDPNYGRYLTLGTSDGATTPSDFSAFHSGLDTFIYNNTPGMSPSTPSAFGTPGGDKITMTFRIPIHSISFDWEVFPNGDCGTCTSTSGRYPDFELLAGMVGATSPTDTFAASGGYFPVIKPAGNNYAQGLGHVELTFSQPMNYVEFVDWPDRIAIDRLDPTNNVPEPGSLLLVGVGLAGLGLRRKRGAAR